MTLMGIPYACVWFQACVSTTTWVSYLNSLSFIVFVVVIVVQAALFQVDNVLKDNNGQSYYRCQNQACAYKSMCFSSTSH